MAQSLYNAQTNQYTNPEFAAPNTPGVLVDTPVAGGAPVISSNILSGNVAPLNIPPAPVTIPTTPPSVTSPTGTTVDTNGNAVVIPPKTDTTQTNYQSIIQKLGLAGDTLATKPEVTKQLQDEQQLALKTEQATKDYNAYNQKKLQYQQQIEAMQNTGGGTTAGLQQATADFSRKANADLANLAIQAQSSQGLLSAAQQTIKDKLDAQFQPIVDQINFLGTFAQLNQNDLTEKEQFQLQQQSEQKKTDLASITKTADDLHQAMLQNNAPQSVYSAIDKITNDYVAGKITAQDAQSKMYSAAGQYGMTPNTEIRQLDNGQTVIIDKNTGTIVKNLGGAKTAELQPGDNPQLYTGLSTGTATAVRSVVSKFGTEPTIQNFATVQDGYNFASSLDTKTKNPADDQALIYALAKTLDPGSVVREGEYATAQKYSQSWINAYGKGVSQAIAGTGFLSETARTNIKKTIESKYLSTKVGYDNQYKQYVGQINNLTGKNNGELFLRSYDTSKNVSEKDPLGLGIGQTSTSTNPLGI
jgi:hypothetical protein